MNPRTIALPPLPQTDLSRQLPEHPVHVLVQQSAALRRRRSTDVITSI
nr:hypothetical protein [Mesorhizobium sp. M4B.F.Ca.ET.143.01.1.1]